MGAGEGGIGMKWNKEQVKALKGSVRKWQRIINDTGVDLGTDNCPCCKLYYKYNCRGCPIRIVTGQRQCNSTPYDRILGTWELLGKDFSSYSELQKQAAKDELYFLKAILKAGS